MTMPRSQASVSGLYRSPKGNPSMLLGVTIALIVSLLAISAYAVTVYNALVRARQMVQEAWSGIDVQLKRRADLIPNLVETVKGYATHEKDALERVTEMRARAQNVPAGDIQGRAAAEGLLSQALGRLLAVAEAYPDLKASQNFTELQRSLETTEGEIQMSRRYYNGAVRQLNTKVESFPSNLVATQFGFSLADYFELENPDDRKLPNVKFS